MDKQQRIKLIKDVFQPKKGEKVLFLTDITDESIESADSYNSRLQMAADWIEAFKTFETEVVMKDFPATGKNNGPLPDDIIQLAGKADIVIAMTKFSATKPLMEVCTKPGSITRVASMPGVIPDMENTALSADYAEIKKKALAITALLDKAIGADIEFSTGDKLYIDLRNREAEPDEGECVEAGQLINLPSGEGMKAPYEAVADEIAEFGESKTEGIMPIKTDTEVIKLIISNNKITEVKGESKKAEQLRALFKENPSRANIAELGIGCNDKAIIRDVVLEDEKVGLHIAFGASSHIGGKVESDMHQDIVYAKGCPIEAITALLILEDGSKKILVENSEIKIN